jgi:hypothetical protein
MDVKLLAPDFVPSGENKLSEQKQKIKFGEGSCSD